MGKLLHRLRPAFDPQLLKYVAPAYALPIGVHVAASVTGIGLLAEAWYWLFIPAAGLHAIMTAEIASRMAADERGDDAGTDKSDAEREAKLRQGFALIHATDGNRALNDLISERDSLQPLLDRRRGNPSMSVSLVPSLATETFQQGLSVLEDAFDLASAIRASERQRLEGDVTQLQKDVDTLKGDASEAGLLKVKQDALASRQELLATMKQQETRLAELFYLANRCAEELQRARMELAGLRADGSEEGVKAAIDTMRLTINQAKGVQAELKRLGA